MDLQRQNSNVETVANLVRKIIHALICLWMESSLLGSIALRLAFLNCWYIRGPQEFKAICETLCSADKPGQLAQISWFWWVRLNSQLCLTLQAGLPLNVLSEPFATVKPFLGLENLVNHPEFFFTVASCMQHY
jgi:hypothetical protein